MFSQSSIKKTGRQWIDSVSRDRILWQTRFDMVWAKAWYLVLPPHSIPMAVTDVSMTVRVSQQFHHSPLSRTSIDVCWDPIDNPSFRRSRLTCRLSHSFFLIEIFSLFSLTQTVIKSVITNHQTTSMFTQSDRKAIQTKLQILTLFDTWTN